jgi:hypothetical protein
MWLALRSNEAISALVALVLSWKSKGCDQAEAERRLTQFLSEVRAADPPIQEDPVLDVLDFVVGWCSPDACLFP